MTQREGLEELARRCEAATGADRELDLFIASLIREGSIISESRLEAFREGYEPMESVWPRYTASLDGAMTLVGNDAFWRLGNDGEGPDVSAFKATVTSGDGPSLTFHDAVASTPALALTAAALRARATLSEGAGKGEG